MLLVFLCGGCMARVTVKALEAKIAALEARLEIARRVYRDQRVRIGELEAALNTRGTKSACFERRATEFVKRDGSRWVKEVVAHGRAVIRPAAEEVAVWGAGGGGGGGGL